MNIWTEFKTSILPWLLRGRRDFLIAEHAVRLRTARRHGVGRRGLNNRARRSMCSRAAARSQGYTLPPLTSRGDPRTSGAGASDVP